MPDRSGKRKTREQLSKRRPELGYYFIVTDTKETEQNYMLGLRDSIPKELQGKLVIKVCKAKTVDLVNEALNMASLQPQYGEPWIVFDRDQVKDFDKIIATALEKGINVGWSNPCIEIWFSTYFGSMPHIRIRCRAAMDLQKNSYKSLDKNIKNQTKRFIRSCAVMAMNKRPLVLHRES